MVIIVGEKESLLPVKVNSTGLGRITLNSLPRSSLRYQYCRKRSFSHHTHSGDYHEQLNTEDKSKKIWIKFTLHFNHEINSGIALNALIGRVCFIGFCFHDGPSHTI